MIRRRRSRRYTLLLAVIGLLAAVLVAVPGASVAQASQGDLFVVASDQSAGVGGQNWTQDTSITVQVFDELSNAQTLGNGQTTISTTTSPDSSSNYWWGVDTGIGVEPGWTVKATGDQSSYSVTTEVTDVVVEGWDNVCKVFGTTTYDPTYLRVDVYSLGENPVNLGRNATWTFDGSVYSWEADFCLPADEGNEFGAAVPNNLIDPAGQAIHNDGGLGSTMYHYPPEEPGCAEKFAVWPDRDALALECGWDTVDTMVTVDDDGNLANGGVIYSEMIPGGDGWFDIGFDLERLQWVTVDNGVQPVHVHQIANLFLDGFDVAADTVWGRAEPGSEVGVNVWGPGGDASLVIVAGADADDRVPNDGLGPWLADFTVLFDLQPGTQLAAGQQDADYDETDVETSVPFPRFTVNPDRDEVWGQEWIEGSYVTVIVDVDAILDNGVLSTSDPVLVERWGPMPWDVGFGTGVQYDIQPGHVVTVTDGTTTKVHQVTGLAIDGVDDAGDLVFGSGEPGSDVQVALWGTETDSHVERTATAGADLDDGVLDGLGPWTADFSTPIGPEEWQQFRDITPGTSGGAWQADDDGDQTQIDFGPGEAPEEPIIQGYVTEDFFRGQGFTPNGEVTVTLYAAPGGSKIIDAEAIALDEGGQFDYDLFELESGLQPGMQLEVSDTFAGVTKVLDLVDVRFDSFDPDTDEVAGYAPVRPLDGELRLQLTDQNNNRIDDGNGQPIRLFPGGNLWLLDLNLNDPPYDPDGLIEARIEVPDDDGDGTFGQLPQVEASAQHNWVNSNQFDGNTTVAVEVRDGSGDTVLVDAAVEVSPRGEFWVDVEIEPGYEVIVTAPTTGVVKRLTVNSVTFEGIDPSADTAFGTADPDSTVWVQIGNDFDGYELLTRANNAGVWLADFSAEFDVTDDMGGRALAIDPDMDLTIAEMVGEPFIEVDPFLDRIFAYEWPDPGALTATINGTAVSVEPVDRDGRLVYYLFGTFDIATSDLVVVFDRTTLVQKEHQVVPLGVTDIDATDDTITGTAEASAGVFVGANFDDLGAWRWVKADGSGTWFADLAATVDPPDGDGTFDIDKSVNWGMRLAVPDDDGDATVFETPQAVPGLFAAPELALVGTEGSGLSPITISIPDLGYETTAQPTQDRFAIIGDLVLDSYALDPEGYLWGRGVEFAEGDLVPGMVVRSSDVMYEMELTILDFSVDEADTTAETLNGYIEGNGRSVFSFAFRDWVIDEPEDLVGISFAEPVGGPWTLPLCTPASFESNCVSHNLVSTDVGFAAGLESEDEQLPFDLYTIVIWDLRPHITSLDLPIEPVEVDTELVLGAVFTDIEVPDSHTATIDWGDGVTPGDVTSGPGPGSGGTVDARHTYATPGVYTVTLTVTDEFGQTDTATYQYVVVYDPNGGFVTGGGWIDSPAGAYAPDPTMTGKATFGFVSKYQKGATVPTGNTEFVFHAADLEFHSTSYDWLVIAGHQAKYKGIGTINGSGNYGFMLTAIDEALTPSTDVDGFRIKIWDKNNGDAVVYDNQIGAADDAEDATDIGGGSIVIHKGKKNAN